MRTVEVLAVISVCLLSCCAVSRWRDRSTPLTPASPTEYRLEIVEDPDNRRFDLRLVSTTNRPLCVGEHQWPNSLGQLHFARGDVYLIVAGAKYSIKEHNMGYPEGVLRIPPGGQRTGFISLDEFDPGWSSTPDSARKLLFKVQPVYCN